MMKILLDFGKIIVVFKWSVIIVFRSCWSDIGCKKFYKYGDEVFDDINLNK